MYEDEPIDPTKIDLNDPKNWVQKMQYDLQQRRKEKELDAQRVIHNATLPPPATKSALAFERFAETYGNLVKEVKASGRAKTSAIASGLSAKTFAARLRDIRAAITEQGYESPFIPADSNAIMADKVFRELGEWVYCVPRRGKLSAVTVSANTTRFNPLVVSTEEEVNAVFIFMGLKDESGRYQLSDIVLAPPTPSLVPSIARVFCQEFLVNFGGMLNCVEISRKREAEAL